MRTHMLEISFAVLTGAFSPRFYASIFTRVHGTWKSRRARVWPLLRSFHWNSRPGVASMVVENVGKDRTTSFLDWNPLANFFAKLTSGEFVVCKKGFSVLTENDSDWFSPNTPARNLLDGSFRNCIRNCTVVYVCNSDRVNTKREMLRKNIFFHIIRLVYSNQILITYDSKFHRFREISKSFAIILILLLNL